MKEEKNNNPFGWLGEPIANKKTYWIILGILAMIEIFFGISVFFR